MLTKVILPTLGMEIEEATIERWLRAEGEAVRADEPLFIVETEKASMEINAPASGVLRQIVRQAGTNARVTETIAYIETEGTGSQAEAEPLAVAETVPVPPVAGKLRASPAARQLARTLGIDLAQIPGTGIQGRIQGDDVRRFAASTIPVQAPLAVGAAVAPLAAPSVAAPQPHAERLKGRLVPLGRKRRVTAERMAQSAREVARVTLNAEVDAGALVSLRERLRPVYEQAYGVKLTYDDILVKVVATALAEHPYLNARWVPGGIYLVEEINVGVAMAVADGLVVPVVRGADGKRLSEISRELNALTRKAREDKLLPEDMGDGTFTLTNLGMYGVDSFTPIVNPPETAILGVGRIADRAVGRGGQLVLRPTAMLSLSFDHRIVDGAPAAQFLHRVQQLLEEPYLLL